MVSFSSADQEMVRIRKNWALAVAAGDIVGTIFYAKLFEIAPEVRHLFPEIIDDQARKLLQTLNWIVDHLEDGEQLIATAEALAKRHVRYGVEESHYAAVGAALVETLRQGLGEDFSAEDEAAWVHVYGHLSKIMTNAAYPKS